MWSPAPCPSRTVHVGDRLSLTMKSEEDGPVESDIKLEVPSLRAKGLVFWVMKHKRPFLFNHVSSGGLWGEGSHHGGWGSAFSVAECP